MWCAQCKAFLLERWQLGPSTHGSGAISKSFGGTGRLRGTWHAGQLALRGGPHDLDQTTRGMGKGVLGR